MIDLLNHRFVPFFFNTGGPGEGHDDAAKEFVAGKVPNRWAYFAAFAPDGRILAQTGIYDGTEQVFAWLRALLRRHPEFDRPTEAEAAARAKAGTDVAAEEALAIAQQCERLTWYADSERAYARVLAVGDPQQRAEAHRGRLRIQRAEGDWPAHAEALATAAASGEATLLTTDLAIERGLRALATRQFARARIVLESAIAGAANSPRLAELHYEAGRACWFADDRDWAKAHWCWVLDQRPDDRMAMRARLAAGAEAFPYPNSELGGFEPRTGPVGPDALDGGVKKAFRSYERLRERLQAGDFDHAAAKKAAEGEADVQLPRREPPAIDPLETADSFVVQLANADEKARDALADRLAALGVAAAQPLIVAVGNEAFRGRLGAVIATGKLFAAHPEIGHEERGWFERALRPLARSKNADLAAAAQAAQRAMQSGK
ncbi:MAG: hypothetical protein JNK15_16720 [Planctomycetes bacterium]|nr:hypothetical protein [Planctomycetota bacterium]